MRAGHFGARIVVVLCFWLAACSESEQADVSHTVATRIVTLAPNLTELIFDAGAVLQTARERMSSADTAQ